MTSMLNVLQLSSRAFAHLGLEEVAYVKRAAGEAAPGFAIHAADGTCLAIVPDQETALATIRRHDMAPVGLH
jgi:hypothetical protein